MKTILGKRGRPPKTTTATSTPASEPKPAPKFVPRGVATKNRILIAVKDGQIDFAAMGQESAKAVNELMHSPDVQAQFGIGPLKSKFDPKVCEQLYEALGIVLMGGAKLFWKWPDPAIVKLRYTPEEKEILGEPTAKVFDELAPKWLRENQAVASLLVLVGAITQNKLREAAAIAAVLKKNPQAIPAIDPEVMRAHLADDMRAAGLRVTPPSSVPTAASGLHERKPINVVPAAGDVNLGPGNGPEIPQA